jgi:hypothetical protein
MECQWWLLLGVQGEEELRPMQCNAIEREKV